MTRRVGRNIALSLPRRLVADLMHFSQKAPLVSVERRMHLAPLIAARQAAQPRPSWCAIFIKAYSLVSAKHPVLRRAYLQFPWPHLYEHPRTIVTVALERPYGPEQGIFFACLRDPETWRLTDIQNYLMFCKEQPLEEIGSHRRSVRISRLPWPLRRVLWWMGLNVSGWHRARCFGTLGVTTVAALGSSTIEVLSPLTTNLHYGVFDAEGALNARLTCDHRVLDGRAICEALADLEVMLHGKILTELKSLEASQAA
jgi:hypothetical protein